MVIDLDCEYRHAWHGDKEWGPGKIDIGVDLIIKEIHIDNLKKYLSE
jgi:hypothetical protein